MAIHLDLPSPAWLRSNIDQFLENVGDYEQRLSDSSISFDDIDILSILATDCEQLLYSLENTERKYEYKVQTVRYALRGLYCYILRAKAVAVSHGKMIGIVARNGGSPGIPPATYFKSGHQWRTATAFYNARLEDFAKEVAAGVESGHCMPTTIANNLTRKTATETITRPSIKSTVNSQKVMDECLHDLISCADSLRRFCEISDLPIHYLDDWIVETEKPFQAIKKYRQEVRYAISVANAKRD